MVFHEHIFSATLLFIMVQVLAIFKIMKISLQNCHPYIETFDFQFSVYLYLDLSVFFFLSISAKFLRDLFIIESWQYHGFACGRMATQILENAFQHIWSSSVKIRKNENHQYINAVPSPCTEEKLNAFIKNSIAEGNNTVSLLSELLIHKRITSISGKKASNRKTAICIL